MNIINELVNRCIWSTILMIIWEDKAQRQLTWPIKLDTHPTSPHTSDNK